MKRTNPKEVEQGKAGSYIPPFQGYDSLTRLVFLPPISLEVMNIQPLWVKGWFSIGLHFLSNNNHLQGKGKNLPIVNGRYIYTQVDNRFS